MPMDVDAEVRALERMAVAQLQDCYAEVFGEPTRSFHKQHLIRRIAWRMQANAEGGLSERARRRAVELANDSDLRLAAPRSSPPLSATSCGPVLTAPFRPTGASPLPMPGTLLRREYKGQLLLVRVLPHGFEFNGEIYRSLSAIAQKVTGSHWNGVAFFGLKKTRKEDA